jgi:hypothetical protein
MVAARNADRLLCPLVLLASFYSLLRLMIGLVALTGMAQSEKDAEILPSVTRSPFCADASSGQTSSPPIAPSSPRSAPICRPAGSCSSPPTLLAGIASWSGGNGQPFSGAPVVADFCSLRKPKL